MSQFISLAQAVTMTTLYRQEKENILAVPFKNQNILARCETFDREIFDVLLAKTDCKAIRIYYGMDTDLKVHAIVVAVNSLDQDILPPVVPSIALEGGDDEEEYVGEDARRCPDDCPPPSPLNP